MVELSTSVPVCFCNRNYFSAARLRYPDKNQAIKNSEVASESSGQPPRRLSEFRDNKKMLQKTFRTEIYFAEAQPQVISNQKNKKFFFWVFSIAREFINPFPL